MATACTEVPVPRASLLQHWPGNDACEAWRGLWLRAQRHHTRFPLCVELQIVVAAEPNPSPKVQRSCSPRQPLPPRPARNHRGLSFPTAPRAPPCDSEELRVFDKDTKIPVHGDPGTIRNCLQRGAGVGVARPLASSGCGPGFMIAAGCSCIASSRIQKSRAPGGRLLCTGTPGQ